MDSSGQNPPAPGRQSTTVERGSGREQVVRRVFDAPAGVVFEAWTRPDLLRLWWAPRSFGLSFLSCEADARPGGAYRFVFAHPASEHPMAFFGRYLEAERPARLVWTNEEAGEDGPVTTVTFDGRGGDTLVEMRERHPSEAALDAAMASGAACGMSEAFDQLDALLPGLAADAARA